MSRTFQAHLWHQATTSLDLAQTLELRALAVRISHLSQTENVTELFAGLEQAQALINNLRDKSPLGFFWPEPKTGPSDLLHWLRGLVRHLELPGLQTQIPRPIYH